MNRIIVTGGTGYIGSHTVVELQESGYEVVIFDNLSNSNIEVLDGIEKITGIRPIFKQIDVANKPEFFKALEAYQNSDAIIHFAAYKAVGESVNLPLKYYRNNLTGMMNVLEAMQEFSIPNLVFSSSCTVYGQPDVLPVTERTPIKKATSPYGHTKQIGEEFIEEYLQTQSNLKAISLRYFNPIGAHESSLIGELPLGVPDNLIPFVTQTAIGKREMLSVFGNDYETKDGTAIRDYINVVDLAKAHVVSIKRLISKNNKLNYEVFNVGTGNGNSVLEIIKTFQKVTKQKLNYKIVGRRAGDIEKVWADTSFANNELGWKAEIDLDKTLLSAWNWEKNLNQKK